MVALAGSPGSGKSTVAGEVVRRLNKLWREERWWSNESSDLSVAVPMDGFHLYRWQLDAMDVSLPGFHADLAIQTAEIIKIINRPSIAPSTDMNRVFL